MPNETDLGLEIAREASSAGLQDFQATLASFQNRPNPDPGKRPVGGVALPHMGSSARPQAVPRPGAAPPVPPRPGAAHMSHGSVKHSVQSLQAKADQIALQTMMEARRDFIPNLFKNARIAYKAGQNPAAEVKKAGKDFQSNGKAIVEGLEGDIRDGRSVLPKGTPQKAVDVAKAKDLGMRAFQLLGEVDPADFDALEGTIVELAGDIFTDLGSSLLPLVGTAKAGYKAGNAATRAGMKQKDVHGTKQARKVLIQGDPEKAIQSVQRLLERERNLLAAEAGVAAVKLGADVAGYFVDLGIASTVATSCAEAVGRLALHIRMIVRDANEMKAGNELLRTNRLDSAIFEECPLLGAYAVASAETSDLVGFLGGDPQRHGFTLDDLTKLVKKYNDPLVRNATQVISKSRLTVTGLPTDRAAVRAKVQSEKGSLKQRILNRVKEELKKHAPKI